VRYNEADNTVDVLVRVHDVWTLSPGLSFGRKGGENSAKVEFSDTNFLGLGKELSFARSSDVDRSAWEFGYVDPNLFGSWWRLSADYAALSDGSAKALSLERPFYALDTRWSAAFSGADTTSAVSRYSLGHVVEQLQMQERHFEIGGGYSEGLRDGWTRRYLGGIRYDAREFQTLADQPDAAIPADRVVAYPWVGLEVLEDQFVSTRNLDQIGRTEDLYLGLSARLEAGFAATALGSTHDGLILNGKLQAGADLGHEQYLIHSLGFGTRVEGDSLANASIDWSSRYYLRQSVHRVFFAAVSGTVTSHRDPEEQLLLGGDNGLRGYPLRYQAGDQRALVTLEQRFYTDWQPLKLFNVGAAVFFDAGRTWGQDAFAAAPAGWLKDVGLGLRLGSARSGLGNVLHIDLAFPLDRSSDIDSMQLLIETRRSF
jgi:outer membrane protein assembly factor BamA